MTLCAPVILLVEDSESDTLLMEQAFRKARIANRLMRVPSAREAIDYLEGRAAYSDREEFPLPIFILLDLSLPDATGYELLRWIRTKPEIRHLPVVVVTGSEYPEEREVAGEMGADAFFRKHPRFEKLIQMVSDIGASWSLRTAVGHSGYSN